MSKQHEVFRCKYALRLLCYVCIRRCILARSLFLMFCQIFSRIPFQFCKKLRIKYFSLWPLIIFHVMFLWNSLSSYCVLLRKILSDRPLKFGWVTNYYHPKHMGQNSFTQVIPKEPCENIPQ